MQREGEHVVVVLSADQAFGDNCTHTGVIMPVPVHLRAARSTISDVKQEARAYDIRLRFTAIVAAQDVLPWCEQRGARIAMHYSRGLVV